MIPTLVEIDLKRIDDCDHPDIKAGVHYLAKIDDEFHAGTFSRQWYGWNFNAVYDAGYQLDYGGLKGLWRIETRKSRKK